MQHFKFVNWWIRGFVFWCHEQVMRLVFSWKYVVSTSHDLNLTIFTSTSDLHFFTFSSDLRSFFVVVMNHFLSITSMCTVNIFVTKDQSKVNIFLGPIRSWQVKCVKHSKRFDLVFVCHYYFSVLLLFR